KCVNRLCAHESHELMVLFHQCSLESAQVRQFTLSTAVQHELLLERMSVRSQFTKSRAKRKNLLMLNDDTVLGIDENLGLLRRIELDPAARNMRQFRKPLRGGLAEVDPLLLVD